MLCEDCHTNEGTVPFIQIVDQKKTVHHLCSACAEKRSGGATSVTVTLSGLTESEPEQAEAPVPDLVCAFCGTTYAEFKKAGRFGCDGCYVAFGSELEALFKRIHGASRHSGWSAAGGAEEAGSGDLASLRAALKKAVEAERFEEAARLRDQISAMRTKQGAGVSS